MLKRLTRKQQNLCNSNLLDCFCIKKNFWEDDDVWLRITCASIIHRMLVRSMIKKAKVVKAIAVLLVAKRQEKGNFLKMLGYNYPSRKKNKKNFINNRLGPTKAFY